MALLEGLGRSDDDGLAVVGIHGHVSLYLLLRGEVGDIDGENALIGDEYVLLEGEADVVE